MINDLARSRPCEICGAEMLWTQAAWESARGRQAAYRCLNGHAVDPATTRQCPRCGFHDTEVVESAHGQQQCKCFRCGEEFDVPR
jgi:hypothetical protein